MEDPEISLFWRAFNDAHVTIIAKRGKHHGLPGSCGFLAKTIERQVEVIMVFFHLGINKEKNTYVGINI